MTVYYRSLHQYEKREVKQIYRGTQCLTLHPNGNDGVHQAF
jgi:hypothetical protein